MKRFKGFLSLRKSEREPKPQMTPAVNTSKCLYHGNYIAFYFNYITTMGRKRTFNDTDLVQPPNRVAIMEEKDIY